MGRNSRRTAKSVQVSAEERRKLVVAAVVVLIIVIGIAAGISIKVSPRRAPRCFPSALPFPGEKELSPLPTAAQFAKETSVPLDPTGAEVLDTVTPSNIQSTLDRLVSESTFMRFDPIQPAGFRFYKAGQLALNDTSLRVFQSAYQRYLSAIISVGDKVVAINWRGAITKAGFTSLGLWSQSSGYKYDSAMHWNLRVMEVAPQSQVGGSVIAVWPFLVAIYANGIGPAAINFTFYAKANGDGTFITEKPVGLWLQDYISGPYQLLEKTASNELVNVSGIQAVRFTLKVRLVWQLSFDRVVNAYYGISSSSREGYLELSANNGCDWGPKEDLRQSMLTMISLPKVLLSFTKRY